MASMNREMNMPMHLGNNGQFLDENVYFGEYSSNDVSAETLDFAANPNKYLLATPASPSDSSYSEMKPTVAKRSKARRNLNVPDIPAPGKATRKRGGQRATPGSPSGGGRLENSLLVLTKKFLELKSSQSEQLNLNEAASLLGVQKRRLYDITNVLEGIDMIEKTGKNSIRWNDTMRDSPDEMEQMEYLRQEIQRQNEEENQLDQYIHDLRSAVAMVKDDPTDKPYSYVRFSDLYEILGSEREEPQMLIAIKAPFSSQAAIEVVDPVESGRFQMAVRGQKGHELTALLVPDGDQKNVLHVTDNSVFRGMPPPGGELVVPPQATVKNEVDDPELVTPSKYLEILNDGYSAPAFLSPLKMLVEGESSTDTSVATANAFLSLEALDGSQLSYSQYVEAPSVSDLFSQSEWTFNE